MSVGDYFCEIEVVFGCGGSVRRSGLDEQVKKWNAESWKDVKIETPIARYKSLQRHQVAGI